MWSGTIDLIAMLHLLITDDSGQDMVEYALLAAIVGIGSILTWQLIVTAVSDAYSVADADLQDLAECTPDPLSVGGGCS